MRLVLDEEEIVLKPGDVVIQRGTNHAWICKGSEPALLVAVLIDKNFPPEAPGLALALYRSSRSRTKGAVAA